VSQTLSRAFLCVRHGVTDWNSQDRFQGLTDNPINDEGIAQAFAVARRLRWLRIDQIVSSPLRRAVKTARDHCRGIGDTGRRRQ
jgi:broad specificity phosphatase PhoE